MKKLLKILFLLAVLGAAGYYGYGYYLSAQTEVEAASEVSPYQQVPVFRGNLSHSVTGTGSVSISQMEKVSLSYGVTVTEVIVSTGEMVTEGQPLFHVDKDALTETIAALQTELDTCESDMAAISDSYNSTTSLRMPMYGRIKEVYIEAGQYIEDVMAEKGCIALLSLDGWMMVKVNAAEDMAINKPAKIKVSGTSIPGVVRHLENGIATISFSDSYGSVGQEVEVFYGNVSLGVGEAYINMPYQLTTAEKGYISVVYVKENDRKWEGNRIAYLSNTPVSSEYETLGTKRDKLIAQIADAREKLSAGTVNSPIEGIVSSVAEASTVESEANTTLVSLYVGNQKEMVVSVDELDIINVTTDLKAEITMDAISDRTYDATVTRVSQIGTPESGVTVYDVTLSIDGDDQLRIGMNGTATIMISESENVLLVPIAALNTSRDGQYVWLYDESKAAGDTEPGIRTLVTTGMSDENYAEVLTGLSEGDIILVTREATTNRNGMNFSMGGGSMIMNFGSGTAPAGGIAAPAGGGTRNSSVPRN